MPHYRIKLRDPNSDEFRVHRGVFRNEPEARRVIEAKERGCVEYRHPTRELDPTQPDGFALDEMLADEPEGGFPLSKEGGASVKRGLLRLHRQAEPFEIVEIKDLAEPRKPRTEPLP